MPRRRLQLVPADRLAAILGMTPADAPAAAPPQLAGWVPQRTSVTRPLVRARAMSNALGGSVSGSPAPVVPASLVTAPVVPVVLAPVVLGAAIVLNGRHRRPAPPRPAILTVPVALRGVRARPRRLAVLGVLVLLVAAAIVLGIRVAWARSSAQPQPVAAAAHGPPGGLVARSVPAAFASTGATGLPTAAGVLLVHVVGQVRRPGVVRLPPGSRVLDALKAAGGSTSSADLNHLNLARPVADGEQVLVPKPGESIPAGVVPGAGAGVSGSAGQGSAGGGSAGGLIDLNTADATALDSLPGVGPVIAQRILDWRTQHGRFSSVDELGEVTGIGDKLMTQIGPKVRV
jgi:competence protein ComEA